MKTKPKYRIVHPVGGYFTIFNVEKKTLFGWRTVLKHAQMEFCEQYIKNAMDPVVKEY